jgi:hypothetical protein
MKLFTTIGVCTALSALIHYALWAIVFAELFFRWTMAFCLGGGGSLFGPKVSGIAMEALTCLTAPVRSLWGIRGCETVHPWGLFLASSVFWGLVGGIEVWLVLKMFITVEAKARCQPDLVRRPK